MKNLIISVICAAAIASAIFIPIRPINSQVEHHAFTLEAGRIIAKHGVPEIQIIAVGATTPYQADQYAARIVYLLNESYVPPSP